MLFHNCIRFVRVGGVCGISEILHTFIIFAKLIALQIRKKLFRIEGLNAGDYLKFSDMTHDTKITLKAGG